MRGLWPPTALTIFSAYLATLSRHSPEDSGQLPLSHVTRANDGASIRAGPALQQSVTLLHGERGRGRITVKVAFNRVIACAQNIAAIEDGPAKRVSTNRRCGNSDRCVRAICKQ